MGTPTTSMDRTPNLTAGFNFLGGDIRNCFWFGVSFQVWVNGNSCCSRRWFSFGQACAEPAILTILFLYSSGVDSFGLPSWPGSLGCPTHAWWWCTSVPGIEFGSWKPVHPGPVALVLAAETKLS